MHFRVGKTDGVSIEMASWRKMLESLGCTVSFCAGPESIGSEYVIPNLEQQLNDNVFVLDQESFGGLKNYDEKTFLDSFNTISHTILKEFQAVVKDFDPTDIIISNIFSVGEGLVAAKAITTVLDEIRVNTILVNHDFYWEPIRYKNPSFGFISNYLREYFPPKRDYMKYCTINSIAKKSFLDRTGIDSTVFFDTFDYEHESWKKTNRISKFLEGKGLSDNTFIFLQATRIVRRKNIELAVDFIKEFEKSYAGKKDIVLLLSGYIERRDIKYFDSLLAYAQELGITIVYIGDHLHKDYELFDIYPFADVITYPSEYEGFGNQLLEAFNAEKPVVIFEYPVYKEDIKHLGFNVISLGDTIEGVRKNGLKYINPKVNRDAVLDLIAVMNDAKELRSIVSKNKKIANENFGYSVTRERLVDLLS